MIAPSKWRFHPAVMIGIRRRIDGKSTQQSYGWSFIGPFNPKGRTRSCMQDSVQGSQLRPVEEIVRPPRCMRDEQINSSPSSLELCPTTGLACDNDWFHPQIFLLKKICYVGRMSKWMEHEREDHHRAIPIEAFSTRIICHCLKQNQ